MVLLLFQYGVVVVVVVEDGAVVDANFVVGVNGDDEEPLMAISAVDW
jgi:hypothetical protein